MSQSQNHILDAEILDPQPTQFNSSPPTASTVRTTAPTFAHSSVQGYHSLNLLAPLLVVAALIVGWSGLRIYLQGKEDTAYNAGLSAGKAVGQSEGRTQATAELQPKIDQANQQAAAAAAQTAEAVASKAQCDASIAQIKSVLGVK
jgi:hypothetical protein